MTRTEGDREAVKPQPKPRIPPLSPKEKFMIRRALQRSPESPERFGRPRISQDIIAAIKNQALTPERALFTPRIDHRERGTNGVFLEAPVY